jgi:tRNA pseudouridine55 synthase
LSANEKQYIAKFQLGKAYDTFDTTGTIRAESSMQPDFATVETALQTMVGETELTVPAFSAKKINGRRAYDLARKGELEDAGTVMMSIKRIELTKYSYPDGEFVVDCGKGTYVRSIINELGTKTGAYAAMSGLIRSKNGTFHMDTAKKLSEIADMVEAGELDQLLMPIQTVLYLSKLVVNGFAAGKLANGVAPQATAYLPTPPALDNGAQCLLMSENGVLLALGEFIGGAVPVRLSKVFVTP